MSVVTQEFIDLLEKNPRLAARFKEILSLTENSGSELITRADAAEIAVINQMRNLGKESLESWAENEANRLSKNVSLDLKMKKHSKKN